MKKILILVLVLAFLVPNVSANIFDDIKAFLSPNPTPISQQVTYYVVITPNGDYYVTQQLGQDANNVINVGTNKDEEILEILNQIEENKEILSKNHQLVDNYLNDRNINVIRVDLTKDGRVVKSYYYVKGTGVLLDSYGGDVQQRIIFDVNKVKEKLETLKNTNDFMDKVKRYLGII